MRYVVDISRRFRDCLRMRMFDMGMKFLFDWKNYTAFQSGHEDPQIRVASCDAAPGDPMPIVDCAVGTGALVDIKNERLFEELISARKEVFIGVKYPVVVAGNIRRGRRKRARKTLTYSVNLLKLDLLSMTSFTHCSFEMLLVQHVLVLRHIFRSSLVLRRMFIGRIRYIN